MTTVPTVTAGTVPPLWPGDHAAVRDLWPLDPAAAYLNHGAFGATPRPVLEEQRRWRERLEAQPFDFLIRRYGGYVAAARTAVAAFLDAEEEGLAFVVNATTAVATVLRSLGLGAGDRVVTTDHVYPAVEIQLRALGVDLVCVPVDLAAPDPAALLLAAVEEAPTRLVVLDAVTSVTGLVLPVDAVVAGCRTREVPCLVDAAHAPGQQPVSLRGLAPDFWTGNLHKWCCAPKGAAVLWVSSEWRDRVRPLVPSTWYADGYHQAFDWVGTADPSAWLAAPAALDLLGSLGWETVRSYGRALARWGACAVGLPAPAPPERQAQLVLLDAGLASYEDAVALRDRVWASHRVEVGATGWRGRGWLRLSAAAYNTPDDYLRLAEALR